MLILSPGCIRSPLNGWKGTLPLQRLQRLLHLLRLARVAKNKKKCNEEQQEM
jgi:hypothetical protein